MKNLITFLLLVTGKNIFSQPVIGMSGGVSINSSAVMNMQGGVKIKSSHVYYNQIVHLTRRAEVNQIVGLRYGYNLKSLQPFIGYDFHLNTNSVENKKNKAGFYLAYGLTKYFESVPIMVSVSKSGMYTFLCAGIYKVL